jgi:hypothetical protein
MFRRRKLPKTHKGAWFVVLDWSYLPSSWQGWLLYIPYVTYLIAVFVVLNQQSASIGATLFAVIPYWISGIVVMHWIAGHKS